MWRLPLVGDGHMHRLGQKKLYTKSILMEDEIEVQSSSELNKLQQNSISALHMFETKDAENE